MFMVPRTWGNYIVVTVKKVYILLPNQMIFWHLTPYSLTILTSDVEVTDLRPVLTHVSFFYPKLYLKASKNVLISTLSPQKLPA
jgi:hypothetical protein